jgi:hypothetical protein
MSGDEILALIVSGVLGLMGWSTWLGGLLRLKPALRRTISTLKSPRRGVNLPPCHERLHPNPLMASATSSA